MPDKIVLIGAGGHASTIIDAACGKAYAFIDDLVNEFYGLKRISDPEKGTISIISFGAVTPEVLKRRQKVFEEYVKDGVKFATVIHPKAIVSEMAKIGAGSFVAAGAIINASAKIGRNVIINTGAIIEHDVQIGDGAHIAPGAIILGGAKIGKGAMIGAGAVVLPGKEIAEGAMFKSLTR